MVETRYPKCRWQDGDFLLNFILARLSLHRFSPYDRPSYPLLSTLNYTRVLKSHPYYI